MAVDGWDCSFPRDASRLEPSANKEPLSECGDQEETLMAAGGIHPQFLGPHGPHSALGQLVLLLLTAEEAGPGVMGGCTAARGRSSIWGGEDAARGTARELGLLLAGLRVAWLLALVSSLKGESKSC